MPETNTNSTIKSYESLIKALSSTKDIIDIVCEELNGNMKLKDAKLSIKEGTTDTFDLPMAISRQLKDANKSRTKELFGKALVLIRGNCADRIKLANEAITKEKQADKSKSLDEAMLSKHAETIKECISTATAAHFTAGRLLSEALDMFKEAKQPVSKWLEWANTACSVKKAQAYALVKIHNTFGPDTEFKNCSMRVLNIMVHLSPDMFNLVKDEALEQAKQGKLSTNKIKAIIGKHKPEPKEPKKPAPKKVQENNDNDKSDEDPDRTTKHMQNEVNGSSNGSVTSKDDSEELAKLRKENAELKKQLAEMNDTLKRIEKKEVSQPKTVAPVLPQFSSKAPNVVLGVTLGAGKVEINNTYRAMAKIFTALTCPEGAKALKAAREELLKGK
jgi:hypothetical protein